MTCSDTFAPSYTTSAASETGAVAAQVEERRRAKYQHLDTSHSFIPVAVEIMGVSGPLTHTFLKDLGCRITRGEVRFHSYLGNAASVMAPQEVWQHLTIFFLSFSVFFYHHLCYFKLLAVFAIYIILLRFCFTGFSC